MSIKITGVKITINVENTEKGSIYSIAGRGNTPSQALFSLINRYGDKRNSGTKEEIQGFFEPLIPKNRQ